MDNIPAAIIAVLARFRGGDAEAALAVAAVIVGHVRLAREIGRRLIEPRAVGKRGTALKINVEAVSGRLNATRHRVYIFIVYGGGNRLMSGCP